MSAARLVLSWCNVDDKVGLDEAEALRSEVKRLQTSLLRDQLASEVRTERFVVVDENDQELTYSRTDEHSAAFVVRWGSDQDGVSVYM